MTTKVKEERETWTGKLDFTMSALSFAVGMGNLWRFPYLCYRGGGGAFLLPYLVAMFFAGYPLMFIELALGQFGRQGVISIWKICPLFEACAGSEIQRAAKNCSIFNGTWFNRSCIYQEDVQDELSWQQLVNLSKQQPFATPTSEFFHRNMLNISSGFHDMGEVRWPLALCLLLCWIAVFFSLARGIKVSGKVTYITALLPYVVLFILLVRGVTLTGAINGIKYYLLPDFHKLRHAQVWGDAAVQVFFSLSLCWGGLITLASYNKFNNNCLRDAIVVATGDMLTSIFGGFVIFSILGYMANQLDVSVGEVAEKGPGLAFVIYPEGLSQLPLSSLWSVLFMIMLINVGLGSQMGLISTVHTTLIDKLPGMFNNSRKRLLLLIVICLIGFISGLTMCTRGGIYMLLLLDSYTASYALLILAFSECIALSWIYGIERFYGDIEMMLGGHLTVFWKYCWRYVSPLFIVFIFIFVLVDFSRSSYGDYQFPIFYDLLGWSIVVFIILCIPVCMLWKISLTTKTGSVKMRFQILSQPALDWATHVYKHNKDTKDGLILRENDL